MNRFFIVMIFCCSTVAVAWPSSANADGQLNLQSAQVAYGVSLYEEYCANCHQGFAKTTKPQRSVKRLRSSIKYFPVMNSLDFLDDQQLVAIAAALKTIPLKQATLKQ